ncbi:serine hydrolase domain-containing protein [Novosphingobium sp.]|uniref:serine hydrolase domain-containing protein n=1 Tax=Novosphingobium sp. TaxID=1874826 RepID=UPI002605DD44|nr:serine hydrolase domain-containing protein [Novosphingobium sp.]
MVTKKLQAESSMRVRLSMLRSTVLTALCLRHWTARAYRSGYSDLERQVPFRIDTISEAGSVAKQFMAAQVLLLAEDGKLSLDDDIRRYLPEMPVYNRPVTIYHLLHHISGIREYGTLLALKGYPRFYRTVHDNDTAFALIAGQRSLNFEPGDHFEYNNSNYVLLTRIVERVSGMSATEFGRQRLFKPLGMTATSWRNDARTLVSGRAMAYRPAAAGYELFMPTENTYGHGALLTTVADLERWNTALISGALSDFVTRHLLAPGQLNDGSTRPYGSGIILSDRSGQPVFHHGGITAGYYAELWALPRSRISIALLCNANVANFAELAGQAADVAMGLPAQKPVAASPMKPPSAPETTALFRSAGGELVSVGRSGEVTVVDLFTRGGPIGFSGSGKALLASTPLGRADLTWVSDDRLLLAIENRETMRFERVAPAPAKPLTQGRYLSRDLRTHFQLSRDANGYRLDLEDPDAPDQVTFRLQWLTGENYRALVTSRSGALRDDMVITFDQKLQRTTGFSMSSVAGLQGVDMLKFVRTSE